MHRKHIIDKLRSYELTNPKDRETVTQFLQFIERNPNCFERSLKEGHITGSAWLLDSEKKKALLMHHKKLNKWLQLGGHADGDSNILRVALRESKEESGIDQIKSLSEEIFDLDIHLIPSRKEEPEHYHYDIRYLFQVVKNDSYTVNHESNDMKWFTADELSHMDLDSSMKKLLAKWQAVTVSI